MSLQAMIMAGGEGERLRPLTSHTPKPLVPLLGKPVMGYAIELLKKHGVNEIGVSLWYLPDKIRKAFGKGEKEGVHLKYFEEKTALGTAGSVKMAKKHLKDTFFVLSGDGLSNCDLTSALQFHKEKQALATLILKRVDIPLPYGCVLKDKEDRVTRFIEKPGWSRVFSDLVNTGIYILEPDIFDYIPDEGMPDFGKDVFPALLSGGLPVYGFETEDYWCDVGDQRAYLQAQMDLMEGKTGLEHPSGIAETAQADSGAMIEGACVIGENVRIGAGAKILSSVIGDGCVIGPGAVIEKSCLWNNVIVQEKARVTGSVICSSAAVRAGTEVTDGCAMGERASAGPNAFLRPGVKIWPHLKVCPGAVARENVISGDFCAPQWTEAGADCDSPESVCAICAAFVKVTGAKRVIVGSDQNHSMRMLACGALSAQGAKVIDIGIATLPMLRTLCNTLQTEGGVFCEGQSIQLFQKGGMLLNSRQITALNGCVLRRDTPPAFGEQTEIKRFLGAEEVYLSNIVPRSNGKALLSPVRVICERSGMERLAKEGLERLGARNVQLGMPREGEEESLETRFLLSKRGDDLSVMAGNDTLSREERTLLCLQLFGNSTGTLYDLPMVPRAAGNLFPLQAEDDSEICSRQRILMRDGLAMLFLIASALKQGPISLLIQGLPRCHAQSVDIDCALGDKGKILRTLCDQIDLPHTMEEGLLIHHDKGYAAIVPDNHRGVVHISSESGDMEFARELCDFYENKIKGILRTQ